MPSQCYLCFFLYPFVCGSRRPGHGKLAEISFGSTWEPTGPSVTLFLLYPRWVQFLERSMTGIFSAGHKYRNLWYWSGRYLQSEPNCPLLIGIIWHIKFNVSDHCHFQLESIHAVMLLHWMVVNSSPNIKVTEIPWVVICNSNIRNYLTDKQTFNVRLFEVEYLLIWQFWASRRGWESSSPCPQWLLLLGESRHTISANYRPIEHPRHRSPAGIQGQGTGAEIVVETYGRLRAFRNKGLWGLILVSK